MLRTLAYLALLVLGVSAVVGYIVLSPWISLPEDPPEVIDARWAKVIRWSEASPESAGRPGARERLAAATGSLARSEAEVLHNGGPDTPLTDADLDEHARRALDALLTWSAAGGGLGDDPCVHDTSLADPETSAQEPSLSPVALLQLAQVAIRSSSSADDPLLDAALELGCDLRARGPALFGLVGGAIAEEARAVATSRGWSPSAAFHRDPPTDHALFGIIARDYFCQVQMVERLVDNDETLGTGGNGWRSFVQERVGIERELEMLRWYLGRQLTATHRVADDPAALIESLAVPEPDELPTSLVVRTMVFDLSGPARTFLEQADAYAQFLAE